ncbi:hypothetical protein [Rhizobium terrae]|uniref:hypothetical protein n=1 Tax=Rhizobium terrae TaxID=2171756 RepID=UPI000E3BC7B8|nr:hypothetical protein [Rhizobium terrae]
MSVRIEQQDGYSNDLLAYFATWAANDSYRGHGYFNSSTQPYDQWGAGDKYADAASAEGSTESGVILSGEDFTYTQGNFAGNIQALTFGTGIYDASATSFGLDQVGLVLDLTNASLTTAFTYSIYILSNYGSFADQNVFGTVRPGLFSYLAEQGTEQIGTGSADVQYSFAGDDAFTGNGGADTFAFLSTTIGEDVITDFANGTDHIRFSTSVFANYTAVSSAAAQVGSDVVITHSAGDTVTIENFTLAQLDSSDFFFV